MRMYSRFWVSIGTSGGMWGTVAIVQVGQIELESALLMIIEPFSTLVNLLNGKWSDFQHLHCSPGRFTLTITHTFLHHWVAAAIQGPHRERLGFSVLLKDTSAFGKLVPGFEPANPIISSQQCTGEVDLHDQWLVAYCLIEAFRSNNELVWLVNIV